MLLYFWSNKYNIRNFQKHKKIFDPKSLNSSVCMINNIYIFQIIVQTFFKTPTLVPMLD